MTANAAGRILNSSEKKKSITDSCVCYSEVKKKHGNHKEKARVLQWVLRELVCRKILISFIAIGQERDYMRLFEVCPKSIRSFAIKRTGQ